MAYAVWATKIGLRRLRKTAIVGTEVTSLWQAIPQAATTHRKCSIADSYKTRTCTCTHVYGKYKILGTDTLCHGLCLLTGLVPESPGEVSSQRAQPTVPASPVRRPLPWWRSVHLPRPRISSCRSRFPGAYGGVQWRRRSRAIPLPGRLLGVHGGLRRLLAGVRPTRSRRYLLR